MQFLTNETDKEKTRGREKKGGGQRILNKFHGSQVQLDHLDGTKKEWNSFEKMWKFLSTTLEVTLIEKEILERERKRRGREKERNIEIKSWNKWSKKIKKRT